MALTDRDSVLKFGSTWYRDRYLAEERARAVIESLQIAAGAALLAFPLLVATIGYLLWRLLGGGAKPCP